MVRLLLNRTQLSHQTWKTWLNVSGRFWWPRLRWRNTREIRRCWWICSTASPSLMPARLNCERPGWTAWRESMWRTETYQRSETRDHSIHLIGRICWWHLNIIKSTSSTDSLCSLQFIEGCCFVCHNMFNSVNVTLFNLTLTCCLQAAMCYVHVAALVAEYLRRKGAFTVTHHTAAADLSVRIVPRVKAPPASLKRSNISTMCRHDQTGLLGVPCGHSEHWWGSSDDGGCRHAGRPFQWSVYYTTDRIFVPSIVLRTD